MIATNEAVDVLRHGWQDAATSLAADVPEVAELLQARLEMAIATQRLDERHLLDTIQEVESVSSRAGSPSGQALARRLRRTVYEYLLALDAARPLETVSGAMQQPHTGGGSPLVGAEEIAALGHVSTAREAVQPGVRSGEAPDPEVVSAAAAPATTDVSETSSGDESPEGDAPAGRRRFGLRRRQRQEAGAAGGGADAVVGDDTAAEMVSVEPSTADAQPEPAPDDRSAPAGEAAPARDEPREASTSAVEGAAADQTAAAFVAPRAGFHIVEDAPAHRADQDQRPLEMPAFSSDEVTGDRAEATPPDAELTVQALAEPEAQAVADPEAQAVAEPEVQDVAEPAAQAVAEPEAQAVAEPEAQAVAEPEAQAVAEPEAQAVAEPEAQAVAEPEAQAVAEPEATDAGAEAQAVAEAEVQVVAEPQVRAIPEPEIDDAGADFIAWRQPPTLSPAADEPTAPAAFPGAPPPLAAPPAPPVLVQPLDGAQAAAAVDPPDEDDDTEGRGWGVRRRGEGRSSRRGVPSVAAPHVEDDPFENNTRLSDMRRRIEERLRRKRCDEAAALLQEVAQETGGRAVAELAMNAGDRCRALGKSNAALNCYLAAARSDPVYELPLSRLADICIDNQDTELAVSYLERIARIYRFRGEDSPALRTYRRIATIAPYREDVLTLLMNAQRTGQLE